MSDSIPTMMDLHEGERQESNRGTTNILCISIKTI